MILRTTYTKMSQNGCWYFVTSRINPQTHEYHCSFHPRVFQGIVSIEEREYPIYGFRLIQGHTRRCGGDRREDFLDLESMLRRRDHVAVILRATGFDPLIQADSSSNNALSNIRTWRITRAQTGLSPLAGYLYKPWDYWTTEWYSLA